MTQNSLLKFEEHNIRMTVREGEPMWVAKDVCDILGINNSRQAMSKLDPDEKDAVILSDTIGRQQKMTVVTQPGLFALIMRSDKPEAKRFDRWIRHEVLPAIMKYGAYVAPGANLPDMGMHGVLTQFAGTVENLALEVAQIKANMAEAWQSSGMLPEPNGVFPEFSNYQKIHLAAREYCRITGCSWKALWPKVYSLMGLAYKTNLERRFKNAQKAGWRGSKLSFAIHIGFGDPIYNTLIAMLDVVRGTFLRSA